MSDLPTRVDVLQVLLDTSALAQDLFDAVEADGSAGLDAAATRDTIAKMGELGGRLEGIRRALLLRYALAGHAADDFLAEIRASLGRQLDGVGG